MTMTRAVSVKCLLLAFLLAAGNHVAQAQKKPLCLMLYQMADNNLEPAIRADLVELTQSNLVKDPDVTTWVYFDALNLGFMMYEREEPIPEIYNPDGTSVDGDENGEKFQGSRYFTYDTEQEKMIVNTTLEGEQNSDSPDVIYNFAVHALKDCVAQGSEEFFFALSSHGGGYAGFGGDENQGRRRLITDNYAIVGALERALADVEGAPSKYDMIGFDACLMQALGALDDFGPIARYFLASEATEPGHGWAYYALNPHDNVEELGKEIVTTFVEETQNFGFSGFVLNVLFYQTGGHQTPKTLAVVEIENGYTRFHQAWESLSEVFHQILLAGEDAKFHAQLGRARASSIRFQGMQDYSGLTATLTKSEVDVGSFLASFAELCEIDPSSELYSVFTEAQSAYEEMFVISETGEGTPKATGATTHWPSKYYYQQYPWLFDDDSLNSTHPWYTQTAPQWNAFLNEYLKGPKPYLSSASSCTCGSDIVFSGDLLIDTTFDTTKGISIEAKVPDQADIVWIDVGIDITALIGTDQYSRLRQRRLSEEETNCPRETFNNDHAIRRYHKSQAILSRRKRRRELKSTETRRRTQEEGDFLYGYGADVAVQFGCGDFSALWDGRFFLLEDPDGKWDWAYVEDAGNGAKTIPVLYFPGDIPQDTEDKLVNLVLTYEEAVDAGAVEGSLAFSIQPCEGYVYNNLALYTYDENGVYETPKSAGGTVVPIVYVYGVVYGVERYYYLGGFNGTSFAWSEDYNMTVSPQNIDDILTNFNLTTAVVEVYAEDLDFFEDNTTDPSLPSNYTGFDLEFFEAGVGDFGLLGLDVYDECVWGDVEDVSRGSGAVRMIYGMTRPVSLLVFASLSIGAWLL